LLYNYFKEKSSGSEENMYRSKNLIEGKIKQLKFVYFERIKRYEGKIFVHDGKDIKRDCYPFNIDVANFLTIGRNIFQYALKETGTNKKFRELYNSYIEGRPLLKFFKGLRDSEIHIGPGGHHTTIELESRIIREGEEDQVLSK